MPFSGGTFTRIYNWVTDRNNNVKIRADRMDAEFDGIATGLSTTMLRDGTSVATANLPMGGFRLRNLGNTIPRATAGTGTAYTLTSGESLTDANVYDGVTVVVRPHAASGATPTLAVDTMTARPIRRQDGLQIGTNELVADSTYTMTYRASDTSWYIQGAALPSISGVGGQFLRVNVAATAFEFATVGGITRVVRTSNTALTASNSGNLIDITSGTFTQTFNACSALGSGWLCYIRNSGTGDVTLDPNASELIDGLSSFVMYPGEVRLIQCDGSALNSIVLTPFSRVFTASGTFTKPPGYSALLVQGWGAGGGGGKLNSGGFFAGGGGGGAFVSHIILASAVSASTTVTIGAGGAGATADGGTGLVGGSTTFGSLLTAFGGGGGSGGTSGANSGSGGGGGGALAAGSNGTPSSLGGNGGQPNFEASGGRFYGGVGFGGGHGGGASAVPANAAMGGGGGGTTTVSGGNSVWGGGGGGNNNTLTAGTSVFGGSGGAGATTASGTVGSAPGGGGGATVSGASAGSGGRGEIRVFGVV